MKILFAIIVSRVSSTKKVKCTKAIETIINEIKNQKPNDNLVYKLSS